MSKNVDHSSSSDDETSVDAFREACDENFLPQSLFATKDSSISEAEKKFDREVKVSLRVREQTDNFESFGVSQSFKDFVAKKLDALLDRSLLDEIENDSADDIPKKKKKRLKNKAGIKLLSSSKEIMTNVEDGENDVQGRVKKPLKVAPESERSNETKCKEVAVDPGWILSKEETKAWSERCRGAVFKYKKGCDGRLIEQR